MTSSRRHHHRDSVAQYLERLMGGPLTLGGTLAAIRRGERKGLVKLAALLGISRTQLVDIEHGRRTVTLERAASFAVALEQSQTQFVRLALQDQIRAA
jgi:transcriptional regulator with XRE-family HTH domain